jgi:hypothetical protein
MNGLFALAAFGAVGYVLYRVALRTPAANVPTAGAPAAGSNAFGAPAAGTSAEYDNDVGGANPDACSQASYSPPIGMMLNPSISSAMANGSCCGPDQGGSATCVDDGGTSTTFVTFLPAWGD